MGVEGGKGIHTHMMVGKSRNNTVKKKGSTYFHRVEVYHFRRLAFRRVDQPAGHCWLELDPLWSHQYRVLQCLVPSSVRTRSSEGVRSQQKK
jgi:hypothetical protein